jgi:hypothetical protein
VSRPTCTRKIYDVECGKPAVDFIEKDGKKTWLCAEHWDKREKLKVMLTKMRKEREMKKL